MKRMKRMMASQIPGIEVDSTALGRSPPGNIYVDLDFAILEGLRVLQPHILSIVAENFRIRQNSNICVGSVAITSTNAVSIELGLSERRLPVLDFARKCLLANLASLEEDVANRKS